MRDLPPIHPGEILLEEFLKPMGISQYRLAKDISVPAMRISKICNGQRGISADTALRLARYFGNSVEFWTGIQSHYDTEWTEIELGDRLEKEVAEIKPIKRKPERARPVGLARKKYPGFKLNDECLEPLPDEVIADFHDENSCGE